MGADRQILEKYQAGRLGPPYKVAQVVYCTRLLVEGKRAGAEILA